MDHHPTSGLWSGPSKRDAILAGAYRAFARYGYANTKIETIAELAGVGKGTIYLYFENKEDVFRQMVKELIERHLDALRGRLSGDGSPGARLLAVFELHMAILKRHPYSFSLHGRDVGPADEDLRNWLREQKRRFIRDLERTIEEGIRTGEFRRVNARSAALWVFALLGIAFLEEVLQDVGWEDRLKTFIDLMRNGLWSQPNDTALV
ncbi:MAG: TetR/AcrR family transcriptional regulator [Hydrogenibacillus sp.]|nr:TetR/AcrR family transcriptional regulator [Hydrogenibacillus sp.]